MSTTKDFGPIRDDYAFFVEHSTEAFEDLHAYLPHVQPLAARKHIRMLDAGCGDGGFSALFLKRAGFKTDRLTIGLVEPVDAWRAQAMERVAAFTAHPVEAWTTIPADIENRFDLILANHMLYYVPDISTSVAALHRVLAIDGIFVTAMAGQNNVLIQFWNECFARIGIPVPFFTAENLVAALHERDIAFDTEAVQYELKFHDGEDNRLHIMRFLLGSYFDRVPRQEMLRLFDPYVVGSKIHIPITHDQFRVRKQGIVM